MARVYTPEGAKPSQNKQEAGPTERKQGGKKTDEKKEQAGK